MQLASANRMKMIVENAVFVNSFFKKSTKSADFRQIDCRDFFERSILL